jgi:hypothetical protein
MASFLLLSATGELEPGALAVLMSDNALRRIADMRSSVSPALVFKGLGFDNVVALGLAINRRAARRLVRRSRLGGLL